MRRNSLSEKFAFSPWRTTIRASEGTMYSRWNAEPRDTTMSAGASRQTHAFLQSWTCQGKSMVFSISTSRAPGRAAARFNQKSRPNAGLAADPWKHLSSMPGSTICAEP